MPNIQRPEKLVKSLIISVQSIFYTIQGEGPFTGTPAIFIRLAGCNLQCPLCDTDYTSSRKYYTVAQILIECNKLSKDGLVVITGGEPFRQDIEQLLKSLTNGGYYVQIETNGTIAPPNITYSKDCFKRSGIYIVCSPKTTNINKAIEQNSCCFKYVLSYNSIDQVDKLPINVLDLTGKVYRPQNTQTPIYVQPADHGNKEENDKNLKAATNSALDKKYIIQLQAHKILGLP